MAERTFTCDVRGKTTVLTVRGSLHADACGDLEEVDFAARDVVPCMPSGKVHTVGEVGEVAIRRLLFLGGVQLVFI